MLEKLKLHEGEIFYTVTGLPFTYKFVSWNSIVIIRNGLEINRIVHITQVEKARRMNPQKTSDISQKIIAGSYVFALLQDNRLK